MRKLNHVYEVYTVDNGEDIIVDILRFASKEDIAEFEAGIVGEYKVRPHTMSPAELVDYLLDHIADIEEDLFLARSYIDNINGSLNSSKNVKSKSRASAKIHPFPVQNR